MRFYQHEISPRGRIYALGSDNWRDLIVPFRPDDLEYVECDGTLLWILEATNGDDGITIGLFDIKSENFRVWPGPPKAKFGFNPYLVKLGDAIACVMKDRVSHCVWILRDKVNRIWAKE